MFKKSAKVTDPICGMSIDAATAADTVEYEGATYHFCSSHCAQTFTADPAAYTGAGTP